MDLPHLHRLLEVLRTLRGPDGCAWDQHQDLASAARYLSDEVFEYVEAATRGDDEAATAELADLFYMLAFNWLLLHERTAVEFDELPRRGADKLVRRKPHVFAPHPRYEGLSHEEIWRRAKAQEQDAEPGLTPGRVPAEPSPASLLKDLHPSASALRQAWMHGHLAAKCSFDWSSPDPVIAKVHEELDELAQARRDQDADAIEDELGDLLFATVQLARKLDVDPDLALRRTNEKFARRFRAIEARHANDPERLRALGLEGLWREWAAVKRDESSKD